MDIKQDLLNRIKTKDLVVGIVGLGYVGLPLLRSFSAKGFRCIGFDQDKSKIEMLRCGQSYIKHISVEQIYLGIKSGQVEVTAESAKFGSCDAILIAVPTPLTVHREPDMQYVIATAEAIAKHLRPGQVIILESTTYPGTTREVMIPILESSGFKLERDFMVGYSPEREDPNNPDFTTGNIPKVVGSTSPEGLEVVQNLYDQIVSKTVPVQSVEVAEATKLMENIFRAVNIALVNELKIAFEKMGIDIWEVIEGSKTKPFGFMPFYPGPGLGGHCIPIDPFYLSWKARQYGVNTRFIELAGEINRAMTDHVVMRVMEALSDQGKPLKGANIHIMGLAYKPNVDDDRESPSYYLMEQLEQRGAIVSYHDPHIPVIRPSRLFTKFAGRKSVNLNGIHDLVLIVTAHDEYADIDFYGLNIPVVDTRNIVAGKSDLLYKA